MLVKLAIFSPLAFTARSAVASPKPAELILRASDGGSDSSGNNTCSTGPIQCCNSVKSASDPATSLLLGLLDVVVQGVDVLVGLDCSPITVIGVGAGSSW